MTNTVSNLQIGYEYDEKEAQSREFTACYIVILMISSPKKMLVSSGH